MTTSTTADQLEKLFAESDALHEEWKQINLTKDGHIRKRVSPAEDTRNFEIAMAGAALSKKISKLTNQTYEALMA